MAQAEQFWGKSGEIKDLCFAQEALLRIFEERFRTPVIMCIGFLKLLFLLTSVPVKTSECLTCHLDRLGGNDLSISQVCASV